MRSGVSRLRVRLPAREIALSGRRTYAPAFAAPTLVVRRCGPGTAHRLLIRVGLASLEGLPCNGIASSTVGRSREDRDRERACVAAGGRPWASRSSGGVAALPRGYDTPLCERGANLSGGQRQRLSLARGVLAAAAEDHRHASLLLLDEPTSALDPMTETRVLRQLTEAFPDACIVASIHRLSALAHFDNVVYMDEGRVIDQGPYAQLLERQPGLRALAAQDRQAEAG